MFERNENLSNFHRNYPAAAILLSLNILSFLLTHLPGMPAALLYEKLYGVNLYISNGEYWRLITPIFLHGSFSHLVLNCFSLAVLGPFIERSLGVRLFLIFYLASGISANLATYWSRPLTFTHIGSSGAVFGLLGFYLCLALFKKERLGSHNSKMILTLSVIGLTMTFLQPQINIAGHIGGFLFGFLLTLALLKVIS
ncbi:rhomboid family intramembrane serine protease [Peribacillus kribbensis]|uniref:rhomboid family intramembrane serine protease n=1 Tax=Peribacillus kribbensis TaxID=356658 RepID=UPI000423254E|nr:rhomboid family intramembrane serine protease [Peribacillus kribbensis]